MEYIQAAGENNSSEACDTPVLFLVFNRPETTQRVFDAIRRAKPRRLFVAADGARPDVPGEAERCKAVRAIVEAVNWDCEVKTLFRDQNLGCRRAVSSAIDWFFEQVEVGIILEDDCLPSDSFFGFCTDLLHRYAEEERVMMISGDNFQDGIRRGDASYYFSTIPWIWGWATWRRAWTLYDVEMASFPGQLRKTGLQNISEDIDIRNYWIDSFIKTHEGRINTWDYQWIYCIQTRHGLTICPQVNMVSNIGFMPGSTHLADADSKFAGIPANDMETIEHPTLVVPHAVADNYQYNTYLNARFNDIGNPVMRLRKKLRKRAKVKKMTRRFLCNL